MVYDCISVQDLKAEDVANLLIVRVPCSNPIGVFILQLDPQPISQV